MSAVIGASHVLCSIGSGTDQVWAAARAGIGRIVNSHVMDRHFEPIQMGLVPEDALGELNPEIEKLPLPSRARRADIVHECDAEIWRYGVDSNANHAEPRCCRNHCSSIIKIQTIVP